MADTINTLRREVVTILKDYDPACNAEAFEAIVNRLVPIGERLARKNAAPLTDA